ncbi:MAG: hypothetical protein ACOCWG_06475, partial [bacterium]
LLGMGNPPTKAWKALVKQMGVMMYLKYLNKISRENALDMDLMEQKLTVSNLKKAKVFPFRLYTAYKHIAGDVSMEVRNYLADVLNNYVTEYDWGKWDKKIVIAPDTSGSMGGGWGYSWGKGPIPAVIAGMLSGIIYKGVKSSMLLPWGSEICTNIVRPRGDSVLSHIESIENCRGGGTNMGAPVEHMLRNKIKCDLFILVTDSEDWQSRGWITNWIKYRKQNKNAKAVLIRVVESNHTNPYSEEQAEKYGIYQVYGWNDNVLKYIDQVVLD